MRADTLVPITGLEDGPLTLRTDLLGRRFPKPAGLADLHTGVETDPDRQDCDHGHEGRRLHGDTSALMIAGRPTPVEVSSENARAAWTTRA